MTPRSVSRRAFLGTAGAGACLARLARCGRGYLDRGHSLAACSAEVCAVVPFHGTHQAGIVTPAQAGCCSRRSTCSPTTATSSSVLLQEWTRGVASHDRRAAGRHRQRRPGRAARRHRRGRRSRAVVAYGHVRLRRVAVRPPGRSVRHRGAEAGGTRAHADVRGRRDPTRHRSDGRPRGAGVCRRPDGVLPRHPQPHPHRTRRGRAALVAVRASGARRAPTPKQETPRNLMGFKDGTNNLVAEDTESAAASTSGCRRPTTPRGCAAAATW